MPLLRLDGVPPPHPYIRGRMPLLRLNEVSRRILTFAAGCRSYGSIGFPPHPYIRGRMPLLRLDEVCRPILTFAARCPSYGSMVALPFLPISPAPLLLHRRRRRIPARAEWIASDSRQAGMTAKLKIVHSSFITHHSSLLSPLSGRTCFFVGHSPDEAEGPCREQATAGLPIGRVASATAPDARRRDDVDAVPSSRSENTAGGVVPRQPFGRKGLRVSYFVPVRRKGLHPVFLTAPRI